MHPPKKALVCEHSSKESAWGNVSKSQTELVKDKKENPLPTAQDQHLSI